MPFRRPSASVPLASPPTSSSSRTHRSHESHHAVNPSHSLTSLGGTITPQQKVIQVLVARLKNKLPCNSGTPLDRLESDETTQNTVESLVSLSGDSLDFIAWNLTEQLERLAKQTEPNGSISIPVLQSQLFFLKVLSLAMASRWHLRDPPHNSQAGPRSSSRTSSRPAGSSSAPESPLPTGGAAASRARFDHTSTPPPWWSEPPPLDDNGAKYVLSVMVLFLRQTQPAEVTLSTARPSDSTFRDSENLFEGSAPLPMPPLDSTIMEPPLPSIPKHQQPSLRTRPSSSSFNSMSPSFSSTLVPLVGGMAYPTTHPTQLQSSWPLNEQIAKFAGRIIWHISAANWKVVFNRLRTKIHFLASQSSDAPAESTKEADTVDLSVLSHSILDRARLIQVLNELSSLLVNMNAEAQLAIATPLRTAVWNWIEHFTDDFNECTRARGRLEGAPERVFDLFYSKVQPGTEKLMWPLLTVLGCISSDRLSIDVDSLTMGGVGAARGHRFCSEILKHARGHTKLAEVSMVSALDICRAAIFLRPEGEVPLRMLAHDIAHEVKTAMWTSTAQKKPFWDSLEDIDLSLWSETLVAIYRFLPVEDTVPIFATCAEPERSEAVKTVVVRACLTLSEDAPRFPWQRSPDPLNSRLGHRFRDIFRTASIRRTEVDQFGNLKRILLRPKSKKIAFQPLSDREVLLLGLLSLWRISGRTYIDGLTKAGQEEWIATSARMWDAPIDNSVKLSVAKTTIATAEGLLMMVRDEENAEMFDMIHFSVLRSLPVTLLCIAVNLIHARTEVETQRLWTMTCLQFLGIYLRKTDSEPFREIQLDSSRVPAFILLEIALLVSLTTADNDASHLAAQGLRLICQAERQPGAPSNPLVNGEDLAKRHAAYEQLGDPKVMVVGRVGHQKRLRKLLRSNPCPASAHVAMWQECYWRWRSLSESTIETVDQTSDGFLKKRSIIPGATTDQRFQWQNLTLFLAALCGPCVLDKVDLTSLANAMPVKDLPDEMRNMQHPMSYVSSFVNELTKLLMSEDVQIRDVARDALGAEMSYRLYPRLLRHVDDILAELAGQDLTSQQNFAMFADQFMAVLRLVVENNHVRADEVVSLDIGSTMFGFATLISRFNNLESLRIKMKFCSLCDSLCDQPSTLTLRRDSSARRNVLDHVVEWIKTPDLVSPEWVQSQNELNLCCLRTAVKLMERLDLKPEDAPTGDDSTHVVSRRFNKYSSVLLGGLEQLSLADIPTSDSSSEVGSLQQKMRVAKKEAQIRELVISGLAHLVSANTETGFKQCLLLAYHEDNMKRTIFAHVFARVIGQGTKFDPEERLPSQAKHNRLVELVKQPDMTLVLAICETCPASDVDGIVSVLLNMFDTRSSLMTLIKLMIDREVTRTENEAALFRSNSTCVRFLSAFARIHGYNYLRTLIIPLIKVMESGPGCYDLDPSKLPPGQDINENRQQVELVAASFLDILESSTPTIPSMFREICVHITHAVTQVWPDAKFAALGAFMFLRFISPAIVAPDAIDIPTTEELRRGLLVIAKIIQNMANNIFFGKEAHMTSLNDFLGQHIADLTRYLSTINRYSPEEDEDEEWLGGTSDDTDIIVLHRFFDKHADKIGKELLSISKPSDNDTFAVSGKRAWDGLCTLLVDLGAPLDTPKLSTSSSSEHLDYLQLVNRFANRSTESVANIFLETDHSTDPAFFILRLSKIDVETLDVELLMYHCFKLLGSAKYESHSFSLILDCTGFTSISEVPLPWIKSCIELVPSDIRARFLTTYILNTSSLAQKYLKRLYNIGAGIRLCSEVTTVASVAELLEHVPESVIPLLGSSAELEQEACDVYPDVMMKRSNFVRLPAYLTVAQTHIRITSVRAQNISTHLTSKSVEIIPMSDIGDVYNVLTGQDVMNEFIIRRNRSSSTIYLTSPSREAIVKSIRSAKGRLKDVQALVADRFSQFSNVPATLLHIGLLSVDPNDEELRAAAYDLLGSVCDYLNYDRSPLVAARSGFVPGDPNSFVIDLSERMAEFAPQLSLDLISEVSIAMNSMPSSQLAQRISCLQYLSPWIKNLGHFSNPASPLYERSGARLRDCIRVLCDSSIAYPQLNSCFTQFVWSEVGKLDSIVVDVVLDELIRSAIDAGIGTHRCETIANILASISSISVRGRLFSRLRKAVMRASPSLARTFVENAAWGEVSTLLRIVLIAGCETQPPGSSQLYVPEIAHIVTLVAGLGSAIVRKSVYGLVVNLLQALVISKRDEAREDEGQLGELRHLIEEFGQQEVLRLFGLYRSSPTSEYEKHDPPNDRANMDNQERLVQIMGRLLQTAAGNNGLLNVWRARWMGLATSSAFQYSSIIQMRSFTALGSLATVGVDDDLQYQMLVALKGALSHSTETDTLAVVSMLRTISKVAPGLSDGSRFVPQLVWLAVAFLQASHMSFYVEATRILRFTVQDMERRGMFRIAPPPIVLLDGRTELEHVACQFDQRLQLSFDQPYFSFSLAAIIFKGVRYSGLREAAEALLRTLLQVTIRSVEFSEAERTSVNGIHDTLRPDALGYFIALLPFATSATDYRRLLEDCNAEDSWLPDVDGTAADDVARISIGFLGITDSNTALLVTTFIGSILSTAQGDDAETEVLFGLLSDIAGSFPDIIAMTYESLQDRIRDTLASSNNPTIIRYASDLVRVALQESPRYAPASVRGSTTTVVEEGPGPGRTHLHALEELNMHGLVNNFAFLQGTSATKVVNWISELVGVIVT